MAKVVEYKTSLDQTQPTQLKLAVNNSQTIADGDLLVMASGRVSKAGAAATLVCGIAQQAITTGVRATGTLTWAGVSVDNEIVTIGTDVYELTVDTVFQAGRIKVYISGTSADVGVVALAKAINLNLNSQFTAVSDTSGDTVVITAKNCGTKYNGIATTEGCTNASWGAGVTASGTNTTKDGVAVTDDDVIPVLLISDKTVIRLQRLATARGVTPMDILTTWMDIVAAQTVDCDDVTGGLLTPVAYDNTAGWIDCLVKASALWNA